ncbi:MAG TPA: hypothetical protein VNL71_07600 [Chloroflexota bacterium]|nr:hypothetical protein [Chloroflexota bacterium]
MIERQPVPHAGIDMGIKYRDLLRPIGAYLDFLHARYVTVAETEKGFLWHCYPHGDLTQPRSGFIARGDVGTLQEEMLKAHRPAKSGWFGKGPRSIKLDKKSTQRRKSACPEGYQEALRVLSTKLDDQRAVNVLVVEQKDCLAVRFHGVVPVYLRVNATRADSIPCFRDEQYTGQEMGELTAIARSHRGDRFYHH